MKPDYSARKRGQPTMPTAERLYSKVVKTNSGCWEWQGATKNGYGHTIVGSRKDGSRRTISTHRLSYMISNGAIPDGYEVCHKCDNRRCVNPHHLFLGTRQDNVDDRERKGRNNPPKGEANGRTKLATADVLQIREKRMRGVSFGKLAVEYGVCKKTIQDAVSGKNWAHLPQPPKEDL